MLVESQCAVKTGTLDNSFNKACLGRYRRLIDWLIVKGGSCSSVFYIVLGLEALLFHIRMIWYKEETDEAGEHDDVLEEREG